MLVAAVYQVRNPSGSRRGRGDRDEGRREDQSRAPPLASGRRLGGRENMSRAGGRGLCGGREGLGPHPLFVRSRASLLSPPAGLVPFTGSSNRLIRLEQASGPPGPGRDRPLALPRPCVSRFEPWDVDDERSSGSNGRA